MAAKKGTMPPAAGMGRPKGVQNKFTLTLKEAILASFDRVGGIDYLERQARENPTAYLMLLKTVLPMQITGPNNGPIMLVTGVVRAGDEDAELISQNAPAVIEHEPRFKEAPPPAPPTHEGRTVVTASGLRVRRVQSVDD